MVRSVFDESRPFSGASTSTVGKYRQYAAAACCTLHTLWFKSQHQLCNPHLLGQPSPSKATLPAMKFAPFFSRYLPACSPSPQRHPPGQPSLPNTAIPTPSKADMGDDMILSRAARVAKRPESAGQTPRLVLFAVPHRGQQRPSEPGGLVSPWYRPKLFRRTHEGGTECIQSEWVPRSRLAICAPHSSACGEG